MRQTFKNEEMEKNTQSGDSVFVIWAQRSQLGKGME